MENQTLENRNEVEVKKNDQVEVERKRHPGRLYSPAVDIYDRGNHIEVIADMPGVTEADVDVTVEGNLLTIEGRTQLEAPAQDAIYHEFGYGNYFRRFELGAEINAEEISAKIRNGELRLTLPKANRLEKKISVVSG